ncbi:MAG: DUF1015 family protein [Saprospiraceae bacterium]|nr:DUF1015 family protein [Saprospiraceae bacterium]
MANISPFRAALPDLTDIISFDDFFSSAKRKFPLYVRDGIYERSPNPAFYIYRIKRPHRSHTGIIACAQVEDYINGKIKKHEHTLKAKEEKMLSLFDERQALIKPILLTYPNALLIDAFINRWTVSRRASFSIPFQDEEHLFWQIEEDVAVEHIQSMFANCVEKAYICDGHHRAKTAENLYRLHPIENEGEGLESQQEFGRMLAAYFPISEIEVYNYNRSLLSLKGLSTEEFVRQLSTIFEIEVSAFPVQPARKQHMGLYIEGNWYNLKIKEKLCTKLAAMSLTKRLDVHVLNEYVFKGILGIKDVRAEADIKYIEGPKGTFSLERKVREQKAIAAFNLYPVALEDLIQISDEQGTMPPKSTWIEPRMRNGLIAQVHSEKF